MTETTDVRLRAAILDERVAGALWAALETFRFVPGARLVREPDVTLVLSGTPYHTFNVVIDTRFAPDAAYVRIPEVLAAFEPDSYPVTWWVGPGTRPADLGARLAGMGLERSEPEFAMALDLDGWRPPPAGDSAGVLEEVAGPADLDEWLGVMHAAYRWPDARRSALFGAIYQADFARPPAERDTHHFVVRADGVAVACSSLFTAGGQAFVTNIGTKPEARGLGLGTVATVATLVLAREMGRRTATLTASVDGRGLYRRLGFVEAGVIDRYVAGRWRGP